MMLVKLTQHHFHGSYKSYESRRDSIKKDERNMGFGNPITLTDKEKKVSDYLTKLKITECDAGYKDSKSFLPLQNFMDPEVKEEIGESHVYKLLKLLPKGANLNGYLPLLATSEFLYRLTKKDDLYIRRISKGHFEFLFSKHQPPSVGTSEWELLKDVRRKFAEGDLDDWRDDRDDDNFEAWIKNALTFNPDIRDSHHTRWIKLREVLKIGAPLLNYELNFIEHFKFVLHNLYQDTIRYAELATDFPPVYNLHGEVYSKMEVAEMYKRIVDEFKREHKDFVGVKLIYSPPRELSVKKILYYRKDISSLIEKHPDFILGLDFFGEPDLGTSLAKIAPELVKFPVQIRFYLTVGETIWWGYQSDEDLYDAVTLKTSRLRNPYSLLKHPKVMEIIKDKGLAIEIVPMSNLAMGMLKNIMNHPFAMLVANNWPLVIVNDIGGLWGSTGLSYEWYYTYMALTPRNADLSVLKEFALNSWLYSSLPAREKILALKVWARQWAEFLDHMIKLHNL